MLYLLDLEENSFGSSLKTIFSFYLKILRCSSGYLEYDHPEIAVTMKTKEEINVMLNMAREIVKTFRSKGIIHKVEGTEINKVRWLVLRVSV